MKSFNQSASLKSITTILVGLLLLSAASLIDQRFSQTKPMINKESSALNFSIDSLKYVNLGHARVLSSLLWITTLIEGDIEHYKGEANSWMYYRFRSISSLEPFFYKNYLYGGQYLSIIKDDVLGADVLYKTGLSYFPNDFWLSYHAGFNATFEMNRPDIGLRYYDNIYNTEAIFKLAPALNSLISKLKFEQGELTLEDTYSSLLTMYNSLPVGILRDNVEDSLYAIKAEIDLNCLNENQVSCDNHDFYNNAYLKGSNGWYARRPWKPYRIIKKAPHEGELNKTQNRDSN